MSIRFGMHGGWFSGNSCNLQVLSKSAEWLLACEGSKSGSSHYFGHWIVRTTASAPVQALMDDSAKLGGARYALCFAMHF